jgi:hypothetical protein
LPVKRENHWVRRGVAPTKSRASLIKDPVNLSDVVRESRPELMAKSDDFEALKFRKNVLSSYG